MLELLVCFSVILLFYVKFIACQNGYFGINCISKCPYPRYGRKCMEGDCNCAEEVCDVGIGCVTGKSSYICI